MSVDRDDDLRARFAALRSVDRTRAPGFDLRPAPRPRGRALAWSGGALAVAAVLALSLAWRGETPEPEAAATAAPEVMVRLAVDLPSDFLLDDEAADVRRDVPQFAPATNDEVPFL